MRQIQCFKRVPARMHLPDLGRPWAAIFVWPVPTAFDLLALNGREARPRPLTEATGVFAGPVGAVRATRR